ncbi:MAG: hypothetical protein LBR85_03545 [Oscillospiraceae bacterium]|jgi:hypothetical protein|nr:hypothetical protein [Oscillospiraceae bacterium]
MEYENIPFKIPKESDAYEADSAFVVSAIERIIQTAIEQGNNKIILNTNLKLGLPMENINKIAGPIIEAWAYEVFHDICDDINNAYHLINVESRPRLDMADVLLQFKKNGTAITANTDVKATAEDIESSGKEPNITSYSRIRTAYIDDPDFMFIILSLKHKVYSARNADSLLVDGVMEIVKYNAYDLKFISDADINYNPALGTGQIQIKDIHYVDYESRTTWEFCQLLDRKYLNSSRRTIDDWYREAKKNKWIKA